MSEAIEYPTTQPRYLWKPQKGPQLLAIETAEWVDELFFGGARGGGKTDYLLGDFIQEDDLLQGRPWQGVLFRRTYPELDEIVRRSMDLYPATGGEYKVGVHEWRWPNGARLHLRHLDNDADVTRYQGHSFSWIGFDELPNWPNDYAYKALKATLRGPSHAKRMRATGNPGGVGHLWVREYFVDATWRGRLLYTDGETGMSRAYIPSRVQDNKVLLANDPHYVDRLRGVGDPQLVKGWLEGDWDALIGGFFSGWHREEVLVEPFDIGTWPLFGCMDYGETNPTWFGLLAVDYDDVVYLVAEYYAADRGAGDHARGVKELIENCPFTGGRQPSLIYADPSMFTTRRTHDPPLDRAPSDTFADHGLFLRPANNDRITGWRVLHQMLRDGKFKAFRGWTSHLVDAIPTLQRDPRNPEDVLKGGDDHAPDGLRYGLIHVYKPPAPPPTAPAAGTGQHLLDQLKALNQARGRYN